MRKIIRNGKIVTAAEVICGSIIIDEAKITGITAGECALAEPLDSQAEIIDAGGCYLMPGLIDLHCDMLEFAIEPRKKVFFPFNLALHSLQAQFLGAGITTIFHPVSLAGEPGIRSNETAEQIVRAIARFRTEKTALLRHFIHLRWEVLNTAGMEVIERIFEAGLADLFSVMDHSPRHARFKTYDEYKSHVAKNSTLTGEQLIAYTRAQWEKPGTVNPEAEQKLVDYLANHHIPFASHDDDSPRRVDSYRNKGVTIAEFPLNEETARHAIRRNMYAVVGAPNILRNQSHVHNLSARYAIKEGLANIICSDYYCFALLAAVFVLFEEGMDLWQAVAYASLYPARAVGLADRLGSLAVGKEADIIIVRHRSGEVPVVERAMVAGQWTFGAERIRSDE